MTTVVNFHLVNEEGVEEPQPQLPYQLSCYEGEITVPRVGEQVNLPIVGKHRVVDVLYDFPRKEGVIGAPETHVTIEPVEDEQG